MRARNSSSSTPSTFPRSTDRRDDRAPGAGAGAWSEQSYASADERLIAEIGHELGNYFHKLYYWAEFLQEKRADHSGDTAAAEMLGRTIEKLEGFLKDTLDYFRPLTLSPVRASVPESLAAMVVRLRAQLPGWPVGVGDAGSWGHRDLLIDPVRIQTVLRAIARRLTEQASAGSGVHVSVEGRDDGIEAVFRLEDGLGAPDFQSGVACVEWALAERIVRLHGGRLSERPITEGSTAFALYLPFEQ